MADIVETLLALGRCETAVGELRRQHTRLPSQIESAEARAQAARDIIAEQRKRLADAEAHHRAKERELQEAETRRSKFQAQTALVNTNTEYTTLLHEIDEASERISDIETQILEALEQVDAAVGELEQVSAEQKVHERECLAEAEQLRAERVRVEADLEVREGERSELIGLLPSTARARYDRVCRDGSLGTAMVVNQSCARCHRDVPLHTINLVRAGELHHCGNCGRILIVDDAA